MYAHWRWRMGPFSSIGKASTTSVFGFPVGIFGLMNDWDLMSGNYVIYRLAVGNLQIMQQSTVGPPLGMLDDWEYPFVLFLWCLHRQGHSIPRVCEGIENAMVQLNADLPESWQ